MRPQRDDGMRQANIRDLDRREAQDDMLRERVDASSQEVIKGFALLNSGAVVAMLGFTQSLIKQTGWITYKPFALSALAAFFFGALMGPVAYMLRMEAYRSAAEGNIDAGNKWLEKMSIAMAVSFVALIAGAAVAGFGIYWAF